MPLQNRVTPDAKIMQEAWRGTFMGNRGGRIHNPETRQLTGQKWASKRWICCVLKFKNRQRTIMGNSYTELFFLDEVSALSAGHRPCFECRRKDANHFASLWKTVHGFSKKSRADEMDMVLHDERTQNKPTISNQEADALPDASMIKIGKDILAKKNNAWKLWSGDGYTDVQITDDMIELLTPTSIIEVLKAGYEPKWHESAH